MEPSGNSTNDANLQIEAQIRALNASKKEGLGKVSNAARELSSSALHADVSLEMKLKAWKALEGMENWCKPGIIRSLFGAKDNNNHRTNIKLQAQGIRDRFREKLAPTGAGELDAVYTEVMANRKKVGGLAEKFFRSIPVSVLASENVPYKDVDLKAVGFYNAVRSFDERTVKILLLDGVCKTFTGKASLSRALKLAFLELNREGLTPDQTENGWKIITALVHAGAKPTKEMTEVAKKEGRMADITFPSRSK